MFEIARLSTIRMIVDTAGPDAGYYDWDGHAEGETLPDTDLVGLIGFSLTEDSDFHDIVAGIGIVTETDRGLDRLTHLVDRFYRRLKATRRYETFQPDGTHHGVATLFTGTTVAPVARFNARPAQTVSFTARLVVDGS